MLFPEKQSQPATCRLAALAREQKLRFQQGNCRFSVAKFTIKRHLHQFLQRMPLHVQKFAGIEVRCAAVQVAGYEPLVTLRQDGLAVHTARLTLTGGCTALLRVVAELERALPRCRLRSMEWRTATDRRTRRLQLILTLYIQQIVLKE